MGWTWRVETSAGAPAGTDVDIPEFSNQSDAETWLGEAWRELADSGGGQVFLLDEDRVVYGPMSLSTD